MSRSSILSTQSSNSQSLNAERNRRAWADGVMPNVEGNDGTTWYINSELMQYRMRDWNGQRADTKETWWCTHIRINLNQFMSDWTTDDFKMRLLMGLVQSRDATEVHGHKLVQTQCPLKSWWYHWGHLIKGADHTNHSTLLNIGYQVSKQLICWQISP